MTIIYHDEEGNERTLDAWAQVTALTVSVDRKESDGNYGSYGRFLSLTANVPPVLESADDLDGMAFELYGRAESIIEQQMQAARDTLPSALAPVEYTPAVEDVKRRMVQQDSEAVPGGKELLYAPKAEERNPGDWWKVTATHYKLTAGRLELWREGRKGPEAALTEKSPAWPTTWLEHMVMDGSLQPFKKSVEVTQVVSNSDKRNDKGNRYIDVLSLAVK